MKFLTNRWTIFDGDIVKPLIFINIVLIFTVGEKEGLSKLISISSLLLFCLLIVKATIARVLNFPKLALLYMCFWAYSFLSLCWTPNMERALEGIAMVTSAIFTTIVVWLSLNNMRNNKVLTYSVVAALFLNVIFLLLDMIFQKSERLTGLAGNANTAAVTISVLAILCLIFIRNQTVKFSLSYLSITTALLTGSRTIFITIAGLLLITVQDIYKYVTYSREKIVIIVLVLPILFGMVAVNADTLTMKLNNTSAFKRISVNIAGNVDSSAATRIAMIEKGIQLWKNSPIIGHGLRSFTFGHYVYAHNNYVELLSCLGIVGVILYYSFDFVIISKVLPRAIKGSHIHQSLFVIMLILLLYDITVVSYDSRIILVTKVIVAHCAESFGCS